MRLLTFKNVIEKYSKYKLQKTLYLLAKTSFDDNTDSIYFERSNLLSDFDQVTICDKHGKMRNISLPLSFLKMLYIDVSNPKNHIYSFIITASLYVKKYVCDAQAFCLLRVADDDNCDDYKLGLFFANPGEYLNRPIFDWRMMVFDKF